MNYYDIDIKDKIEELIYSDLSSLSPETDVYIESKHKALAESYDKPIPRHFVSENGGVIRCYREDGEFARAYALETYGEGVLILADKKNNRYTTIMLNEDDGWWFISNCNYFAWIYRKPSFIALMSEALSLFNASYKELE